MGRMGVEIRGNLNAVLGLALLTAAMALLARLWLFDLWRTAVFFGFLGASLHFVALIFHHLGHAVAASLVGHPMEAVQLGRWLVLGTSVYPEDERELPGRIHIQRALGGPVGSLILGLICLGLTARLSAEGVGSWLLLWLGADSIFVFFLGVFLPLGFTDLATILRWWGR